MKSSLKIENQVYRKNIKRIIAKHLADRELRKLGGVKGARMHLKKISKNSKNKDFYT